jgi:DNA-binding transcriptional regulator YhcF (GntR family)
MIYSLGPRAQRVYAALQERIRSGECPPGSKLPSHTALAAEFGVAPLTMRQVLAQLEDEGMVIRQQGRGTFVQAHSLPTVLIVEDETAMLTLLRFHVSNAGYRTAEATNREEALSALEADPSVAFILTDVRIPTKEAGISFISAVRNRWPELPLAAVTGYPDDLAELHGKPECPVLILPKPVWARQIEEALRMALRSPSGAGRDGGVSPLRPG